MSVIVSRECQLGLHKKCGIKMWSGIRCECACHPKKKKARKA